MKISGSYKFLQNRALVAKEIVQADTLRALIGNSAEISASGQGFVDFTARRTLAQVKFSVPGRITLRPADQPFAFELSVTAKQMLAGKAQVGLRLVLNDAGPMQTSMTYDGDIVATGLILAAIRAKSNLVQPGLNAVFDRLSAAIAAKTGAPGQPSA